MLVRLGSVVRREARAVRGLSNRPDADGPNGMIAKRTNGQKAQKALIENS